MPLPNPSFGPKTHRWRPRARAPSREVPSQNCAFCVQNRLFWPKTAPKPTQNGQATANGSYIPRAPRLPRDQEPFLALELHYMSGKRPNNGPKWPECALFVSNCPKTKNKPYLGLRGSKLNSEGT